MSEIDPLAALRSFPRPEGSGSESLDASGLGRDAFLKIFLTQLANQDPMSPQDPSELSSQLAVFSQVEQQTLMAEQLRGINSRLDQLLEAYSQTGSKSALDPVALIGKQVRVARSSLHADASGSSDEALHFEIRDPGVQNLLIWGESASGGAIGLASLGVTGGQTELPRGSYTLRLAGRGLELTLPDQSVLSGDALALAPYVLDAATGQPRAVPTGAPGAPDLVPIAAGAEHQLGVATRDRQGSYRALGTSVTGTVSAVRVVDGKQVVTVNGADLDPARISVIQ